jgi:hypothetical protein
MLTDWVSWWRSLGFEMAASTAVLEISGNPNPNPSPSPSPSPNPNP